MNPPISNHESDSVNQETPGASNEQPAPSPACSWGELGIDLDKAKLEVFTAQAKEWPDENPDDWLVVAIDLLQLE